jgi:hypothetical protein
VQEKKTFTDNVDSQKLEKIRHCIPDPQIAIIAGHFHKKRERRYRHSVGWSMEY